MIKKMISAGISAFLAVSMVCQFGLITSADSTMLYSEYVSNSGDSTADLGCKYPVANALKSNSSKMLEQNSQGDTYIAMDSDIGETAFNIEVAKTGLYEIRMTYSANLKLENQSDINFSLKIDGEFPFKEAKSLKLDLFWKDNGETREDGLGNEFAPEQAIIDEWFTLPFYDYEGYELNGMYCLFEEGTHTISLDVKSGSFLLKEISLVSPENINSYEEYISKYDESEYFEGEEKLLEAEENAVKTARYIVPRSDNSDASVVPSDPYLTKINYIGGSNWGSLGDSLSWTVNVKEAGLYKLSFHYRQNTVTDAYVYRQLLIDGKIPFKEASSIGFSYALGWQNKTVGDDEPMLIYLGEGEHTITLRVTLGGISEICNGLKDAVYDISVLYRKLVMIVGDSPDNNRDYELFKKIANFEEDLTASKITLQNLSAEYIEVTGDKGSSIVSLITSMNAVIDRMLKYKYQAQKYKSSFYSAYASLSAGVYELMNMPLDIDSISLSSPESDGERKAGFFKKIAYSMQRFAASFIVDYNSISGVSESEEKLTLWVNWGRDQAQVLNQLIRNKFTPESGISVNVKITNASIVQAVLSGSGPDIVLHLSRTEPVNLAMRGALYDLFQFEDCDKVLGQFVEDAEMPYYYKDGLYALPDTQTFYMMFIRTDIFEELGLETPKTWDDFILTSKLIMQNNMQVGLPYTQITNSGQINSGAAALTIFPSLLIQKGVSMYTEDLSAVNLYSATAIDVFTFWTDFYTKYGLPKTYDFYNRFRTGLMPMAIQGYTMYAQLSTAAAEITGLWKMVEIPGFVSDDGSISNIQAGGGTGCSILDISKNKEAAWEFLKWWVSADTQSDYSFELESILGTVSRVATSNVEAVSRMDWDRESYRSLESQWNKVKEINEVPGGYYVSRGIDQAFWNVVNSNANPKDILYQWNNTINNEIKRKYEQYQTKGE